MMYLLSTTLEDLIKPAACSVSSVATFMGKPGKVGEIKRNVQRQVRVNKIVGER
jgi:hypothetical protein